MITTQSGKVDGRLFWLPLLVRIANRNGPRGREFLICVGGKGKFFKFTNPLELDPWNTQRSKDGLICDSFCIVEAPDVRSAIEKFHQEWDGAKVGGPGRTDKALWINERQAIIAYPPCRRIHKNPKGRYVCGRLEFNDPDELDCSGEFGGCILDGIDPPESCPLYNREEIEGCVEYGGVVYKVVFPAQLSLGEFI
jgi:hypothetical protein